MAATTRGLTVVGRPEVSDRIRLIRKSIVIVALVVAWVIVTQLELVRPIILPGPEDLWGSFMGMAKELPRATLITVSMVLSGFLLGSSFGIVSGLVMAYSPAIRDMLGTIFDFMRPVPVFALIPLFILWFGVGRAPQVALIALGTSVVLGVTSMEAVRNVPLIYVKAAATLGANRRQIYQTVIVPHIIPDMIGAIRVSAAVSWGLDVAAEFMGSQVGLGYLIIFQQVYLRTAGIVVIVIIYSTLAILMDKILGLVEARLTYWTERRAGATREAIGGMVGI